MEEVKKFDGEKLKQNILSRLRRCLEADITEFTIQDNSALFAVPSISAKEVMKIAHQFNLAPNEIGISPHKPESLMVWFEVPENVMCHLEAVIPIKQFVCDICQNPVTDTDYRTNVRVFLTERYLFCEKCWFDSDDEFEVIRTYNAGDVIDDIPREMTAWSLEPLNDEELK